MAMVILAAVATAAPASALWPLDGLLGSGQPARFALAPKLHGVGVGWCDGVSPAVNRCSAPVDPAACAESCAPSIQGTLGYTGSVRATVAGRDCSQGYDPFRGLCSPGWGVAVWQTCSFTAGSLGHAFGVRYGSCDLVQSNAPACAGEPGCVEIWPPLTLTGDAFGGREAPTPAPAGPWRVAVNR